MSWYVSFSLLWFLFSLILLVPGFVGRMLYCVIWCGLRWGMSCLFLVESKGIQEHDRVGDATFDAIAGLTTKHNKENIAILNTTNYSTKQQPRLTSHPSSPPSQTTSATAQSKSNHPRAK